MKSGHRSQEVLLDPEVRSPEVLDYDQQLRNRIVGQDRAVRRMVNMYQIFLAGMNTPGRPVLGRSRRIPFVLGYPHWEQLEQEKEESPSSSTRSVRHGFCSCGLVRLIVSAFELAGMGQQTGTGS